jgi:hypothetical protein
MPGKAPNGPMHASAYQALWRWLLADPDPKDDAPADQAGAPMAEKSCDGITQPTSVSHTAAAEVQR